MLTGEGNVNDNLLASKQASKQLFPQISILYVIATVLVVFMHVDQWTLPYNKYIFYLHHFASAGVPIFFIAAGYLAGKTHIDSPLNWLKKKTLRIYIPFIIVVLPILLIYTVGELETVSLRQWVILLTNLQGLQNYLIIKYDFYNAPAGLGHLWYTSIILLCFAINAFMSLNKPTEKKYNRILLVLICLQPLLCVLHFQIAYLLTFFVGVAISRRQFKKKDLILATIAMTLSVALRIILRRYFDGSILYDYTIVPFQDVLTGVWFFVVVDAFCRRYISLSNRIVMNKVVKWICTHVFEIYLLHSVFLASKISTKMFSNNILLINVLAIAFTIVLSNILHSFSTIVIKYISSRIFKNE